MSEDPLGISIRSERGDHLFLEQFLKKKFLSDFRVIGDFIISDLGYF